jgi:hypothetical protein
MSKNRHTFKLNDAARFMKAAVQAAKATGLSPDRLSFALNPATGEISSTVRDAADGEGGSWDDVNNDPARP